MHGWLDDEDYPNGHRLPMDAHERQAVDADTLDAFADVFDADLLADLAAAMPNPNDAALVLEAARLLPEAARLLRLGIG